MPTKLLLADDSPVIQRVIGLTFAGQDVQVIVAGDGEEAIARITVERPDIVLADIGMPKRSGYDVSAFVKRHPEFGRIPVVLLAGAFDPVDDRRAREAGCDRVLVKPLEPHQVITTVQELIDRANVSRHRPVTPPPAVPALDSFDDDVVLGAALDEFLNRIDQTLPAVGLPDVTSQAPLDGDFADPFLVHSNGSAEPPVPVDVARAEPWVAPLPAPLLEDLLSNVPLPTLDLPAAPTGAEEVQAPGASVEPARHRRVDTVVGHGSRRSAVAQAFSAMLASEHGEPSAIAPVRHEPAGVTPVVTEAMVDDLARRVLERLFDRSGEQIERVARQVVSDVAERLVREEFDRIRTKTAGS